MRKIIVSTDYSAESENATIYAAKAAAEHKYEVVLFTLYNVSAHVLNTRFSGQTIEDILHREKSKLEAKAHSISESYGVTVIPYFTSGSYYEEIEVCINAHHADLVVMGMPQKSMEQDLLGNTTTTTINRLMTPIVAIPLGASYSGIRKILFACDIMRGIHKQTFEKVRFIASKFGAEVEIFHVSDRVEELKAGHKESLDEVMDGIEYYYKNVESTEIVNAIRDEVVEIKADLLIMVPYKYGFWSSLIHKSKTRMMASGINVPLLSIPL